MKNSVDNLGTAPGADVGKPVTGDTITKPQLLKVQDAAYVKGDRVLAACAARAIDGDSLYHRQLLIRCADVYNALFGGRS